MEIHRRMTRYEIIRQLIEVHAGLFEGGDRVSFDELDDHEYFRGQAEMISEMVGVPDALSVMLSPLKAVCIASIRGEDVEPFIEAAMIAADKEVERYGFSLS